MWPVDNFYLIAQQANCKIAITVGLPHRGSHLSYLMPLIYCGIAKFIAIIDL